MVSIKMHMFAMEEAFRRLISYDCKNVVLPSLQQPLLRKKSTTRGRGSTGKKKKKRTKTSSRNGAACRAEPSLPQVPTGGERGVGQVFRALRSPDFQPCAGGRAGLQLRWAPPAVRSGRGLEALGRPESPLPAGSRRLVTLARGLAPAFLRFAGKRTDFLQFHNVKNPAKSRGGPGPDYYLKNYEDDIVRSDIALDKQKGCKIAQHPDIMLELQREKAAQMHLVLLKEQFSNTYSNLTLTARSLDKLYNFADCSGLHLIFALNALRRNPNNSWNSSNALSLLKYSASKKYNISWELGNEPNNYRTLIGRSVNGSQLGKDYIQLRSLLQLIRTYSRANLYGPNIGRPRKNVITLLEGYYIDGRVAKVTDFLKTRLLDTLSDQIRKIQKVVNTYTPGKKIWLEGVGTTSSGGMNNLSDSYAAGFLWLNTLGLLASQGIDVVVRHSFLDHGHNHLVDQNFNPLPDYWLSLLYKRLIGPKVLAIHVAGLQRKPRPGRVIRDKLRIYAHCTSYHNHNYVRGSITLYIINLHRSRKKIKLAGTLRDKIVHQYLLQPYGKDGLHSKLVQLNGQPLAMVDDGTLPELKPRPLRAGRTLVIPPLTMSFYVVKNVNALACRYR
ncbi:inactive heparanase-2 isoform X2 [Haliaeetus albicilla]|uniref:inactive heparanase-2 isoform X2 n=1 Tax=Haliaeetus albicilla TaxID=8969 RepID=UPI0037E90819